LPPAHLSSGRTIWWRPERVERRLERAREAMDLVFGIAASSASLGPNRPISSNEDRGCDFSSPRAFMQSVTGVDDGFAAALFEKYRHPLRRYLRFATGSADLAEDLTQDVFLRVVRGVDGYTPRDRERAWLFRIARNLLTDHARRQGARPTGVDVDAEPIRPALQAQRLSITEALARLDERERHAFLLCELGGLSYDELSEVLDVSVAAVRSLLYRVRLELRATVLRPSPATTVHTTSRNRDDEI
jgi:RNA polymerase sigma factor (sigma-70 family)